MGWFGSNSETLESKIETAFKKSLELNIAEGGTPDVFKDNVRKTLETKKARVNGDKAAYEQVMINNAYFLIVKGEYCYSLFYHMIQGTVALPKNENEFWAHMQNIENMVRNEAPKQAASRYPNSYGKITNYEQRIDSLEFDYLYHMSSCSIQQVALSFILNDRETLKACKEAKFEDVMKLVCHFQLHYLNHRIENRVAAMNKAG